jgi:hypothetical protein
VPLGGNRRATWKTYRNIVVTMALAGLWHGAGWSFVIWGCYLASAASFVIFTALGSVLLDRLPTSIRFLQLDRLAGILRALPRPPDVVILGSSRSASAFRPEILEAVLRPAAADPSTSTAPGSR